MQRTPAAGVDALPLELTSFIGRERELAALDDILRASRLVTLTGAGGSGKSRLARELVTGPRTAPQGVSWVELAPVAEGGMVAAAVLRVLDPRAEKGGTAEPLLVELLRDDPPLLVLDNCEHVVDACALLVDALLRACPKLRILATSREALGVPGERAWLVPPLGLPGADHGTAERSDAVRLFVERARDVMPEFELSVENACAVAEICTRLDGIPLAIELAAARVRLMTPEQIRDRLSDAFALLTSRSRTALPRHRTLLAAMDWSHDLLPDDARVVLRRLSVFRGGFTLDAAEGVASGDDVSAAEVLDLVAALLDRSLLVMREHDGGARYMLLETVRQYAARKLEEAGETEQARRAMAAFYDRMVAGEEPAFTTTSRRGAFARMDLELDNLREVLEWTSTHAQGVHVRLVGMLWWYWFGSRHWLEARRWIEGALAMRDGAAPGLPRAALLFASGALSSLQAQVPAARAALEECIALAGKAGDPRLEAYALNYLGMTYAQLADPASRDHCARAEAWLRPNNDMYGLRLALLLRGMGEAAAGDFVTARTLMEEAVAIARRFGQDRELGIALQTLAGVTFATGDVPATEALLVESLASLQRDWSYLFAGRAVDFLGVTAVQANPREAARRLGAGDALREHVGARRFALDQGRVDAATSRLRELLGDAEFDACFQDGVANRYDVVRQVVASGAAAVQAPAAAAPIDVAPAQAPLAAAVAAAGKVVPAAAVAADADVRATMFGAMQVWVSGEAVTTWAYTKPRELLAFLLTHPRGRTRVEIGAAMWPDATPAQIRNSFHVTLHHLRKALGHADWVVIENDRYRIAPDVSIRTDVMEFEEHLRTAGGTGSDDVAAISALQAATQLYADHFLAGETAGRWRDDEQDRLRGSYTDAGLRLGNLLERGQRSAEAVSLYELLLVREPLLEEAHRRLIRYWSDSGDRVRAARHYERLVARLQDELGLDPDPETTELYEELRAVR